MSSVLTTEQTTSYSLLCDIILARSKYIYDAHDQYFCDNATYSGIPPPTLSAYDKQNIRKISKWTFERL